jgi:hypothetical protein
LFRGIPSNPILFTARKILGVGRDVPSTDSGLFLEIEIVERYPKNTHHHKVHPAYRWQVPEEQSQDEHNREQSSNYTIHLDNNLDLFPGGLPIRQE